MSGSGMTRRVTLALCLGAMMAVGGCAAIYRNHGYVPEDADLAQIVVGKSTREEVAAAIGRPASTGLMEGASWYYVGSRWKYYGALPPKEIDRQVVAVSFDGADKVTNVERFGLERGEVVVLSRRVTASSVKGMGVIRQLLGSLGRVSAGQIVD